MQSDLMLFPDLDIQQKTWHIGLSEPLCASLKQRASRIKGVFVQATMAIGEELASAQKELAYKDSGFVKWLEEEVGLDHQRAYEYIQIWEHYKMLPESGNILSVGRSVLLLSSKEDVPQSAREAIIKEHESGEKVTLERAKEIIEEHKLRAEKAEEKATATQQHLNSFTRLSDEKIGALSQQIADLEEALKKAVTPEQVEVTPQVTLDKIANLEELTRKQQERNGLLSEHIEKLNAELLKQTDANEARRKQEQYATGIKSEWKKATDTLYKALAAFMGQIPSPIAIQVFEGDEWARYDKIDQALKNCQEIFSRVQIERYGGLFVDSNSFHQELTVYGQAQTIDAL